MGINIQIEMPTHVLGLPDEVLGAIAASWASGPASGETSFQHLFSDAFFSLR